MTKAFRVLSVPLLGAASVTACTGMLSSGRTAPQPYYYPYQPAPAYPVSYYGPANTNPGQPNAPAVPLARVFASAPSTLSTADLGRPCDEKFRLLRGATGAPLYARKVGIPGGANQLAVHFLEASDTRGLEANAEGWGILEGDIGRARSRRFLVYRAAEQTDVLEVNDTAYPYRQPPPGATWYIASIFVGRSWEIVVSGDQQSFHAGIKAKLMRYGGGLSTFEDRTSITWSVRGRGLEPNGPESAVFAHTPEAILSAYRRSAPIPIYVEYRNLKAVPPSDHLEWTDAPAPDDVRVDRAAVSCGCVAGHNIALSCRARNLGGRSMDVSVRAHADTGTLGRHAEGTGRATIPANSVVDVPVSAHILGAWFDCSSATSCECSFLEFQPSQAR